MQPPEEFNQEPIRRRRRKRKRRPQQQQQEPNYPLGDNDRMNYWQVGEVDDEPDQENGGIMVTVNGVKGIQNINTEVWHDENDRPRINYPNKNEFVQEMVMQVEGPADNNRQDDVTNKSYRKPYVVPKKEDGESSASDLKNLLKNSGGLSLSEILQKQNLSLDDLLKGKQNAFQALQNTAAPTPTENTLQAKGVRRIPGVKRPISTAASIEQVDNKDLQRSDDHKQTRRLPNFSRTKPDTTIADSVVKQEQNKELGVTLSKFMVPPSPVDNPNAETSAKSDAKPNIYETVTIANLNVRGTSSNRRLPASNPSEKSKPIKEVVSRIRPDLSNSNSRRRLIPIKLRPSLTNTTIATNARQDLKERLPLRYGSGPKLASTASTNKTKINNELLNGSTESSTVEIEVIPTTLATLTVSTTTTTTPITSTPESKENVKDIVRTRLALKPRLKLPHIQPNPTTTTTTTETPPDSTEAISIEQYGSSESNEDMEMTTAPSIDESLSEDEEEKFLFSSEEELKEILDKSEPQINSILEEFALYNGRKSVVPIEDLFEDSPGIEQDIFQTFTSRSDKISVTDRTNEIQKNAMNSYRQENSKLSNGKVDVTERNPSLFSDITSLRTTDDKTDILELLDDRRGGARLTKVLEQRNMTLDELLEHRKRGSSQLHLSEIINNKTKPLTDVHAADKLDIVTAFENFPNFNLPNVKSVKPDDVRTDSDGSSYFTSIINIKPTDEIYKEGRSLKRDQVIKPLMTPTDHHSWKTINYPSQDVNYIDSVKKDIISSSRISPFDDEVLQIENEVARSHDFVDLELSGHGFKPNAVSVESATIPVGVRSAIIASASIVGICLMIFILIFATCRWRQKKRKKLNYSENFQTVRGRLPILTRNSTSSSSTKRSSSPNVFTTMGSRSSKLNTMDPNSPEVQEYLYDAMRKSFR